MKGSDLALQEILMLPAQVFGHLDLEAVKRVHHAEIMYLPAAPPLFHHIR